MPSRLVRTIDEFGAQPRNQDGRGLTAAAREIVGRTLKHIETAIRTSGGRDNLAREARRLLKSLAHIDDFETTAQRASDFFGEVLKAGRRRARETPVCKPQTHVWGDLHGVGEIRLCRVASVADLQ